MVRDYENYSKEALIVHIHELENQLKNTKYGLYWDKNIEQESVIRLCKNKIPVLERENDKCIISDIQAVTHILIEGDNFQALTSLNMMCGNEGFVDVIYIDPPYNRGKDDFRYNDKYVNDDDGYRHSKWISFMSIRLQLARKLLKDNGVVFISIDENEFAQLKLLCDQVFGEKNFIECIIWNKRVPKNDKGIGNIHEYILLYSKRSDFKYKFTMIKEGLEEIESLITECRKRGVSIAETEKKLKKLYRDKGYGRAITLYNAVDENYQVWGKINMSWPNGNTFGPRYDVIHPVTHKPVRVPDRGWRWNQDSFNAAVDYDNIVERYDGSYMCGRIWFSKDENMQPSSIKYLSEVNRMLLRSIISLKSDGSIELERILGQKSLFDYPKSVTLIKLLLNSITNDNKDAIIMDFFAGSGTTAQAVMEMNQEDGGHRRCIICTNNESNICDEVTYPRIKTVITGKRQDGSQYSEGIPANIMYYRTSFVEDSKDTDQAKYCLVEKVDELLCITEETYVAKERTDHYSHYETFFGKKHCFIYSDYYSEEPFQQFRNLINSVDGEKIIYMFSTDNSVDERLFEGLENTIVKPIPNKIYEIYKEIVEDIKRGEQ